LVLQIIFSRHGGLVGELVQKNPEESHISLGFFFNFFPIFIPNFSFFFFPILIVEKIFFPFFLEIFFSFLSSLGFETQERNKEKNYPKKEGNKERKKIPSTISTGPNKESSGCPGQIIVLPFGVWVIGVAPRRVRKIN